MAGRPTMEPAKAELVRAAMRELQRKNGWSPSELARQLKRSAPAIHDILVGTNSPSQETAQRVALLMGVDVWVLLGMRPQGTPDAYSNRERFMQEEEVRNAPREVWDRIKTVDADGGDMPMSEWWRTFNNFMDLHKRGLLSPANDPRAKPAQPRARKVK